MKRNILLAEDHPVFRETIRSMFEAEGIDAVAEVATCREVLEHLEQGSYTHLILDLWLADGNCIGILKDIFERYPAVRVLVLSGQPAELHAGILKTRYGIPYISKTASRADCSATLVDFINNRRIELPGQVDPASNPFSVLPEKEFETLLYLLEGWTRDEIARQMNVKSGTIRRYTYNIKKKTNVRNLMRLKELAFLHHLV